MARSPRVLLVTAAVALTFLAGACGSSSTASDGTTTSSVARGTIPPASVLPTPTTAPGAGPNATVCAALTRALKVAELQPRNTGNWTAERQRIITDAASNVALYEAASNTAPATLTSSLTDLIAYARFVGTAVASAGSFDAAVSSVGTYADKVGASLSTAAVDTFISTNCR